MLTQSSLKIACRGAACYVLLFCFISTAQPQQPPQRVGRKTTAVGRAPAVSSAAQQQFDQVAASANKAREALQLEDAIKLYQQALSLRPAWSEGWWYVATLLYDQDRYSEAARAFKQATRLQPKVGSAWAMMGLCEFQLGDYDNALAHIRQGRDLGLVDNKELTQTLRYHEGILLNLKGMFEQAQKTLRTLSVEGVGTENLIIALGLSSLRIPELPQTITPNHKDRELVRRAGWADHLYVQKNFADAQREYERLVADYPKTTNVQYAYGRYLIAQQHDEEAIEAFKREIINTPNHAFARLQIAYLKLNNKDAAGGLKYAEEAVSLNQSFPLGHYILGRLLFDLGENDRAIAALETSRKLYSEDPKIYFALARAYTKARRKADADRARESFERLSRLAENAQQKSFEIDEPKTEKSSDGSPAAKP